MIDVCDGQGSLVSVKRLAWESTLESALLATPSGLILDRSSNLIPVIWIFCTVHRHGYFLAVGLRDAALRAAGALDSCCSLGTLITLPV
jgi:hypothetical protein